MHVFYKNFTNPSSDLRINATQTIVLQMPAIPCHSLNLNRITWWWYSLRDVERRPVHCSFKRIEARRRLGLSKNDDDAIIWLIDYVKRIASRSNTLLWLIDYVKTIIRSFFSFCTLIEIARQLGEAPVWWSESRGVFRFRFELPLSWSTPRVILAGSLCLNLLHIEAQVINLHV